MRKEAEDVQKEAAGKRDRMEARNRLIILGLLILVLVILILSITVGRYAVRLKDIPRLFREYFSGTIREEDRAAINILFLVRLPRIILAALIGAALSVSGAVYQGLFRNPMVSPDILGVSSGAGAGAALALILGLGSGMVHTMAFLFGITAVTIVMLISKFVAKEGGRILVMILAGTVVSSLFSSMTSLLKYVADPDDQLQEITFWLMGSFAKSGNEKNVLIMLGVCIAGTIPMMLLRFQMNAMSFGEEEAMSLGVNVKAVRLITVICATLLTASSVCIAGMIGWVGLIIPHMTRFLVGPDYRPLLPASMLLGASFMLIVDNVSRVIIPGELPIGILTSIIGAPLFIYLLFKGRKEIG